VELVVLGMAILSEVVATVSLKLADGFTRPLPSVLVVAGYLGAFAALAHVLRAGFPVGIAYAIWAAVGVALVAVIGAVFLGEHLTPVQVLGLVLIIAGVVAVELGAQSS
jgi:small multidrug resistance pump